jgi:hypothetical protein
MLIQQHIPPSLTFGSGNEVFKTDYRLFVYRSRVLAVSARVYQGQVTNLRTQNGGFARLRLVSDGFKQAAPKSHGLLSGDRHAMQ